ncbi:hypothetical protein PCL_03123 [Purpureocillium lilacinum]|uniref:Uncharacterized protein n=1 Tax=Purpureocillium lilacinum TaxID=33203 RepID=A0A2U3DYM0_PURLI|nr:hypothetical protein Purlil1_564 [Purpureocillium lilacinum]PWI67355.1 hypothetical protein PCL_03123 [Purpureocillium lilacinum]
MRTGSMPCVNGGTGGQTFPWGQRLHRPACATFHIGACGSQQKALLSLRCSICRASGGSVPAPHLVSVDILVPSSRLLWPTNRFEPRGDDQGKAGGRQGKKDENAKPLDPDRCPLPGVTAASHQYVRPTWTDSWAARSPDARQGLVIQGHPCIEFNYAAHVSRSLCAQWIMASHGHCI